MYVLLPGKVFTLRGLSPRPRASLRCKQLASAAAACCGRVTAHASRLLKVVASKEALEPRALVGKLLWIYHPRLRVIVISRYGVETVIVGIPQGRILEPLEGVAVVLVLCWRRDQATSWHEGDLERSDIAKV